MHALIVEDEFYVVDAVEQALSQIGFTSFEDANCVADAITAAERLCPDLIVADYRLVDGTGTDAVLAICRGRPIAVVFVTASVAEVRALVPRAVIVSKPFISWVLHEAVEEARRQPFICPAVL